MGFASLIEWIDREWATGFRARFTLALIVSTGWLPLFLIGLNWITISLAAIWALPWTALYLWRLGVWVQRYEERQRRSRKDRRR